MGLNEDVGRRLRDLRAGRGWSLSELARRSDIGKATLSELEAGRRNATLETLYALTTALGLPLSALLTDTDTDTGDGVGPAGQDVHGSAVTAVLTERFADAVAVTDVFRIRIRAGRTQRSAAHIAGTEERLVVLTGVAHVGDPGRPAVVGPGEHAHWPADQPHLYRAPDTDVEAVLFVRYPARPSGSGGFNG